MRRIVAIGSAALLAFTVTTATPAPAADLGMPLKAPPIVAPVGVDYWPIFFAALIATGVGLCIALCEEHHEQGPVTNGGNTPHGLPSS